MSLLPPHPAASELRMSKAFTCPPCCTKTRESRHQAASCLSQKPKYLSPVISMSRPSPLERLEAVVSYAVPQVAVKSLQPLPPTTATGGLQRHFLVTLSDGRTLLLKLPPSQLMLRLLRREHSLTRSEPCVITWIFRELLEKQTQPLASPSPGIPIPQQSLDGQPDVQTGFFSPLQAANTMSMDQGLSAAARPPGDSLLSYLPAIIASSAPNDKSPFSLWEPVTGTPIANLTEPLTPPERRMVEYQKGHLIRRISQLRAPNSRFGPAIAVLGGSVTFSSDTSIAGGGGGGLPPLAPPVGSNSSETWSTAFQAMMEESLRDGEDTSITLPYTPIRRHVNRLSHTLDDVVESCLVLLDAGSDANVLVARSNKKDNAQSPGHILDGPVSSRTEYYVENNASPRAPSSSSPQHSPPSSTSPEKAIARIRVSGLQDWSNCIFGDPLMVDVFSRNPSDDFLRGFRGQPPASAPMEIPSGSQATSTTSLPPTPMNTPESTCPPTVIKMPSKPQFLPLTPYLSSSLPPPTPHSFMPGGATIGGFSGDWASHRSGGSGDDERVANRGTLDGEDSNAAIRLLLYECYHATVCVVKQFYRPSPPESTQRELAARRRLAEVLRKLELVQQHGPIAATSRSGGSSSSSTSNSGNDTGSGMGDNNRRPKSRRASEWDDEDTNEWPTKRARSGARDH